MKLKKLMMVVALLTVWMSTARAADEVVAFSDSDDTSHVEKVQLWEGGPYWATTNIGAEKPEDPGYYFWWGDTVGYKREGDVWVATDGSPSIFSFGSLNTPTYNKSFATLQREGGSDRHGKWRQRPRVGA